MVNADTKIYCLIGSPVKHSLSPVMYNAVFDALGVNCLYVVFNVGRGHAREALDAVRCLGISGVNVTMPLKTEVVECLDEVDAGAGIASSVNTIINEGGKLRGLTTDGRGALKAMLDAIPNLEELTITVVGAGGAGRSLVYELSRIKCRVNLLNRTVEKAKYFVEALKPYSIAKLDYGGLDIKSQTRFIPKADIIVNATSVGMTRQEVPINPEFISKDMLVFDMVYWPPKTPLIIEAERREAKVINGIPMLVYQAVEALKVWLRVEVPANIMFKAVMGEIEERLKREGQGY